MPDVGIGWYPVVAQPYNGAYWESYRERDASPTGGPLTDGRRNLVETYWQGSLVDVGIGGGRFVTECPNARGFDINPQAVEWLKSNGKWLDPYEQHSPAATFWDSLEHIADPRPILAHVGRYVFTSLPIFDGPEHALRSKHFKPEEHCWYFTRDGLVRFMRWFDFELVHEDRREEFCREDIGSFVFRRRYRAE